MAAVAESSSVPLTNDKPVIVRVKRKASQHRVDAFWLEISERPLKRALLDFGKLSVSDSSSTRVEELKTTKILVHHVETVTSSENTIDVLRSFVPNSSDACEYGGEHKERRRTIKTVNKQDELLVKAKESQEVLSRNARYEQIWRSRKGKKDTQEDEMCRLYDVVKIDNEQEIEVKQKDTNLENHESMAEYLPLLREVLPTAAVEIENYIHDHMSTQVSSDDYIYDFYAVTNDDNVIDADSAIQYPLVQVDDDNDDCYDGPDNSDYETDDSNAENNPLNDYPDEEESVDDDEATSRSSDEESEDESRTSGSQSQGSESESQASNEDENSGPDYWSDYADQLSENEMYNGDFDNYSGDE